MSAEPSPRPWRVEQLSAAFADVLDAAGHSIICGEKILKDDAALIVAAVNERDRLAADEARYRAHNVVLRDIVRRFVNLFTPETIHPAGTMERLVREARVAIGEDKA